MSIIVLNPSDTIISSDTLVVKLAKVAEICQPVVKEAETNCKDVWIAAIICLAIVLIACIAKRALGFWLDNLINAKKGEESSKITNEEKKSKVKLKSDCQDKLLTFLEKQVYAYDIQKKEYEKACEAYSKELHSVLEELLNNRIDEKEQKEEKDYPEREFIKELLGHLKGQIALYSRKEEKYNTACKEYKEKLEAIIKTYD